MNKFTLIKENYNLDKFTISREQFLKYKNNIDAILQDIYNSRTIKPQPFEISEGRYVSILNKINTNVNVLKYLVSQFNLNSFDEIIDFINNNSTKIFTNGDILNHIIYIIKQTEKMGDMGEDLAVHYLEKLIHIKTGLEIKPKKTPISSYKDMVLGIDIEFDIKGRIYTCQVKPLISESVKDELTIIKSAGNMKHYEVDYICFSNYITKKVIVFENKDVKILNDSIITIPTKYRKHLE